MTETPAIHPIRHQTKAHKAWDIFFFGLMILNGILPQIIPGHFISPFMMGIEVLLIPYALVFFPIHRQAITLVAFAFLGYEYPLILASVLFILALAIKVWKAQKWTLSLPLILFLLLLLYAILIFTVNAFIFISPSGLIFWFLTFTGPFILMMYLMQFRFTTRDTTILFNFFKTSIVLQFPIILVQAMLMKTILPGDWAGGSMLDAHHCGVFFSIYAFILVLPALTEKKESLKLFNLKFSGTLLITLAFLLITDAKTIYLLILVSLMIYLAFAWLKNILRRPSVLHLGKISRYFVLLASFSILIPVIAQSYIRFVLEDPKADLTEVVGGYLFDEENTFNQKAVWYNRVFSKMKTENEWLWWIGTGPGTFGSRAANTLAYDVMYKETQKIPEFIPPVSSPWTKKYLGDLMTSDLAELITFHSTFLAAPVSGIAAIKAELGWPGLILFVLFAFSLAYSLVPGAYTRELRKYYQPMAIFWILFPLLMLFDNYQEKPIITFPLVILSAVLLKTLHK